jgi:hypothetical protein
MQLIESREILQGSNSAFPTQNIYFILFFVSFSSQKIILSCSNNFGRRWGETGTNITRNPASHTPGRTPAVLVMMSTDLNYTSRLNEFLAIRTWIPASVVSHSLLSLFPCVLIIYFYFLPLSFLPFLYLSLFLSNVLLSVYFMLDLGQWEWPDARTTDQFAWNGEACGCSQSSQRLIIIIRICVGINF